MAYSKNNWKNCDDLAKIERKDIIDLQLPSEIGFGGFLDARVHGSIILHRVRCSYEDEITRKRRCTFCRTFVSFLKQRRKRWRRSRKSAPWPPRMNAKQSRILKHEDVRVQLFPFSPTALCSLRSVWDNSDQLKFGVVLQSPSILKSRQCTHE